MFKLFATQSVIDYLYKIHVTKLVSCHDLIKPQSKNSVIEILVLVLIVVFSCCNTSLVMNTSNISATALEESLINLKHHLSYQRIVLESGKYPQVQSQNTEFPGRHAPDPLSHKWINQLLTSCTVSVTWF